MDKRVPKIVQTNVLSLLSTKSSDGIPMIDFVSEYATHIGQPLKYCNLGFSTLNQFISAIPQVARITKSVQDPNLMVVAMSTSRPNYPSTGRRGPSNKAPIRFDPEVEELEPDAGGRYSLCFSKGLAGDKTSEDLESEFSEAGEVVDVHMSSAMVFVRYRSKEELQKCLRMFKSEYNLRFAKNKSGEGNMQDRNQNTNRDRWDNSKKDGEQDKRSYVNDRNKNSYRNGEKSVSNDREEQEIGTELFASNIEGSEEEFKRTVVRFRPKSIKFIESGVKKYAFLSMWNHEDAAACIRELDRSIQTTRQLMVRYNDRRRDNPTQSDSTFASDSNSDEGHSNRRPVPRSDPRNSGNEKGNGVLGFPELESEYSDLPPLVEDSMIHDPNNIYNYDCAVLVTQFPPQTLESELRGVFKGFKVLDICVINNGYTNGCTKAMIYMSTLYEAVNAVQNKNGFLLHNHPLKIVPPSNNVLLRKILVRMETGLREY